MKYYFLLFLTSFASFYTAGQYTKTTDNDELQFSAEKIVSSRKYFYEKYYTLLNFDFDCKYFDGNSKTISKLAFLDSVLTGDYIPLFKKGKVKRVPQSL